MFFLACFKLIKTSALEVRNGSDQFDEESSDLTMMMLSLIDAATVSDSQFRLIYAHA